MIKNFWVAWKTGRLPTQGKSVKDALSPKGIDKLVLGDPPKLPYTRTFFCHPQSVLGSWIIHIQNQKVINTLDYALHHPCLDENCHTLVSLFHPHCSHYITPHHIIITMLPGLSMISHRLLSSTHYQKGKNSNCSITFHFLGYLLLRLSIKVFLALLFTYNTIFSDTNSKKFCKNNKKSDISFTWSFH